MRKLALIVVLAVAAVASCIVARDTDRRTRRERPTTVEKPTPQRDAPAAGEPAAADPEAGLFFDVYDGEYRIRGRVVDSRGDPIAGARIEYQPGGIGWFGVDDDWRAWDEKLRTPTGADGTFTIERLPPTEWILTVTRAGYGQELVRTVAGDENFTVTMSRGTPVSGRVTFPDGKPAVGASVWAENRIWPDGKPRPWDDLDDPRTDVDGRFRFEMIAPGACVFSVHIDGWRGRTEVDVSEVADVRIVLERIPASLVRVRVLEPDGKPLTGYAVGIGDDTSTNYGAETDAKGRIAGTVEVWPGGEGEIHIRSDEERGLLEYETTVPTLPLDSREEVVVRMPQPIRVTFHVRPVVLTSVEVSEARLVEAYRGCFVFEINPGRTTEYRVDADGYDFQILEDWKPTDGEVVDIRLVPNSKVIGRVVGASKARVAWKDIDRDGRFELVTEPGRFELDVRRTVWGYHQVAVLRRELELESGTTTDVGDLVVPEWSEVSGVIAGEHGRTAGGVLVMAVRKGLGEQGYAVTKADGKFAMRVPRGTPVRIVAWKPDRGCAISQPLAVPGNVEMRLQTAPHLEIEHHPIAIMTDDGYPLSCAETEALPPGTLHLYFADGAQHTVSVAAGERIVVR